MFRVTGKNTGNFLKFGIPLQFWRFISGRIQWFAAKFPAQWDREFLDAYQGIYGQQKRKNWEFLIEKYFISALNVIVEPVALAFSIEQPEPQFNFTVARRARAAILLYSAAADWRTRVSI